MLWQASRGARALYAASFAMMACGMAASFAMPQVVKYAVDCVIGGAQADSRIIAAAAFVCGDSLALCGAAILLCAALGGLFDFGSRRALAEGAEAVTKRIRDSLFERMMYLPYSWHLAIKTGDIVQRCTSDVEVVHAALAVHIAEVARAVALIVIAYGVMFHMNMTLAAVSFIFIPIIIGFSVAFIRRAADRFLAADEAEGELLAIAQENFTGVRVVRAFGQEAAESAKFAAQNAHFADLWVKLGGMLSSYWGLSDLLTGAQLLSICAAGAWLASRGEITAGDFIVFINYSAMMIWPVRGLGRVLSEAGKAGASIGRIMEVLNAPVEEDPADAADELPRGDIELRGVSFSYGGRPALDDVSFIVPEGSTLGILGATGSGKSTLAALLCRLYEIEPGCGEILIGGVDIRRVKRAALRRAVGIVLQEPFLYSDTVARNIASLGDGATMDDIRGAAEAAGIAEDVDRYFPHGYETVVGERGVTLSGGQRQRVAIARAVMRRPPVLIFDDSLSAVDTRTDARIRAALRSRLRGTTVIIIAHRITSVAMADSVVVLDGGRVVEHGTPDELARAGGHYARIAELQRVGMGGAA